MLATEVRDDGSVYYGPFRGRPMVRAVVREVCDLLELRDCAPGTPLRFADQMDLFDFDATPRCVRADLHKCLAPCAGRCTRAAYRARVDEAKRFLEGDLDRPLRLLHNRMTGAADRLQFEYAAALRDRAFRLEGARAELILLRGSIEALSFVYTVPGFRGDDRVYIIRRGSIRFETGAPRDPDAERSIMAHARRVFARRERGPATVDPHQVGEILLVSRWFRLRPDQLAHTVAPDQIHPRA
jgi:excinuclease ABC subunit C